MKTIITIDDALWDAVRRAAAREDTTIDALIHDGLQAMLLALSPSGHGAARDVTIRLVVWPQDQSGVDGLTDGERAVLPFLVQGRTNRQIAGDLCLVTKTVEKRVSNILVKLGFQRRSQVASWAVARGLVVAPRVHACPRVTAPAAYRRRAIAEP